MKNCQPKQAAEPVNQSKKDQKTDKIELSMYKEKSRKVKAKQTDQVLNFDKPMLAPNSKRITKSS